MSNNLARFCSKIVVTKKTAISGVVLRSPFCVLLARSIGVIVVHCSIRNRPRHSILNSLGNTPVRVQRTGIFAIRHSSQTATGSTTGTTGTAGSKHRPEKNHHRNEAQNTAGPGPPRAPRGRRAPPGAPPGPPGPPFFWR